MNHPLLNFVTNLEDTAYFSTTGVTTFEFPPLRTYLANPFTNIFFQPSADIIGSYNNETLLGENIVEW
jgi:hypothetical protein